MGGAAHVTCSPFGEEGVAGVDGAREGASGVECPTAAVVEHSQGGDPMCRNSLTQEFLYYAPSDLWAALEWGRMDGTGSPAFEPGYYLQDK